MKGFKIMQKLWLENSIGSSETYRRDMLDLLCSNQEQAYPHQDDKLKSFVFRRK